MPTASGLNRRACSGLLVAAMVLAFAVSTPGGCELFAPRGRAADLHWLSTQLPALHKDLFRAVPEADYRAAIAELRRSVNDLDEEQYFVALIKLLTPTFTMLSVNHGDHEFLRIFPVELSSFPEGYYITGATSQFGELIGCKLVTIDGVAIEEAVARGLWSIIRPQPRLLYGLGVTRNKDRAAFGLARPDGSQVEVLFGELSRFDQDWIFPIIWAEPGSGLGMSLGVRSPQGPGWGAVNYLQDEHMLFLVYSELVSDGSGAMGEIAAVLKAEPVERILVDMRWASGSEQVMGALIEALAARPGGGGAGAGVGGGGAGRIFAIVADWMRAQTVSDAEELRRQAGAVLFLDATPNRWDGPSARPFGGYQAIELPHSGFTVRYPTEYAEPVADPLGTPVPDYVVVQSAADFLASRWSVLEAIRGYREPR